MIIRVQCNNVKEKHILFDLMELSGLGAVFTRAIMKGYLDESEDREVEFVQLSIDTPLQHKDCCKVLTFFLEYVQDMTGGTINERL